MTTDDILRQYFADVRDAAANALDAMARAVPPPPLTRQYRAVTDRDPRPTPALLPPGPAGTVFTDPTFGSRLLRVTADTGVSWRTPSNAGQRAWSADSRACYVLNSHGTVAAYAFDPQTMTAMRIPHALPIYTEPAFHPTEPGVLIGGSAKSELPMLVSVTLSTGAVSLLLDLTAIVPRLRTAPRTYVGPLTTGGEYFCVAFGGESQDRHYLVWVAPFTAPRNDGLLFDAHARLDGANLHGCTIDQSGRYVWMQTAAVPTSRQYIWDIVSDTVTPLTARTDGHGALGYGTMVNMDGGGGPQRWDAAQWAFRRLHTPNDVRSLITPVLDPKVVSLADHSSWTCASPDDLQPFISGTYLQTSTEDWRAWTDEIIAVSPDDGTVWRFCHTRTALQRGVLSHWYGWDCPRPNVSPDGRWAIFTSNWEKTLGTDAVDGAARQDVFLVELVEA